VHQNIVLAFDSIDLRMSFINPSTTGDIFFPDFIQYSSSQANVLKLSVNVFGVFVTPILGIINPQYSFF
jgi:hypothetical protein